MEQSGGTVVDVGVAYVIKCDGTVVLTDSEYFFSDDAEAIQFAVEEAGRGAGN